MAMKSDENKCAMNYNIITNNNWIDTHNMQITMRNKCTHDDVHNQRLRGAYRAMSVHIERTDPHLWWHRTPHWLKSWALSHSIHGKIHGALSLIRPLPSSFTLPFSFLRLLPPPRAVLWVRQPDRHGKFALFRCKWEWGHPERVPLYEPNLLTFGKLNDSSVPLSCPRTKTWMTWHLARCSQRHTEDKPITADQKACQSVSRRHL